MNKYIEFKNHIKSVLHGKCFICLGMDENNFNYEMETIHDILIDELWELFQTNNKFVSVSMIEKYYKYLEMEYNKMINVYKCEKFHENKSYCVTVTDETTHGIIAQKHIMNCDKQSAKSFKRHFDKLNYMFWNDCNQSGLYCLIVSRNYCTNHMDFETDINGETISYYI